MSVSAHDQVLPRVLPTHTPGLFAIAVAEAVALLKRGEVVVLPTETVYGLAANALNPAAVSRIYSIKGRPAHNPIIVHIADPDMARAYAAHWPESAAQLASSFWPGPLTIVVEKAPSVPDIVTAGGSTVGLRWPSHPFIQAVIRACGFPLAAPSANRSNELSPTNAEHVRRTLGSAVPLIIDGGQSQVGIESTVVDVTCHPPRILRPGMIHAESIQATVEWASPAAEESGVPAAARSPGLLPRHYSPRARLIILEWTQPEALPARLAAAGLNPADCHIVAHTSIPSAEPYASVRVIPHDAEAYARALYAELHQCDGDNAKCIVVEAVPDTPEWKGIADRLTRASRQDHRESSRDT